MPHILPLFKNLHPFEMMYTSRPVVSFMPSTVSTPYMPPGIINVVQPSFAFERTASRSRYGSLPTTAIPIRFRDSDVTYPGIPVARDSMFLEDREDIVLYPHGSFPPTNATLHIQVTGFFSI